MQREQICIEIDGQEARDLYDDLSWVEIETDEELAALFRFELAMPSLPDGSWAHLDDDRLALWREVRLSVGFDDGPEPVMTGFITHLLPSFDGDPARCRLQVWGMDATVLLDREERLRAWPSMSDSDIASAVIEEHGLTPDVDDTGVVHDEAVSTILQRETDAQLLRRLALRNGFECFADGTTVHFRAPGRLTEVQPTLAVHFGAESNVASMSVQVQAPGPGEVGMAQLDRTEKEVLSTVVAASEREPLGASGAADLLGQRVARARTFVAMTPVTSAAEMQRLCQALYERGDGFVTGDGVVDGNAYGTVLRPRQPVTIKGLGEQHSGVYDVTAVLHSVGLEGYRQHFRVRRNGLGPTGTEDFTGAGGTGGR